MILPILTYPNPLLKKKAEKIKDPKDPEIRELVLDMLETLKQSQGVGLASPQVGRNLKLCVLKINNNTLVLINPKITSRSFKKETLEEGCLSFPGQFYPVKRNKKITVNALDRKGKPIIIKASDMLSRVLQHEIDHLEGFLIIDRK
jgi:peptide deformylase